MYVRAAQRHKRWRVSGDVLRSYNSPTPIIPPPLSRRIPRVSSRSEGGDETRALEEGRAPETATIYPRVRLPILALCLKEHIDRATLSHRLRDLTRWPWPLFERYVPSCCSRSLTHDAKSDRGYGSPIYMIQ